jgi:hypothetical protein
MVIVNLQITATVDGQIEETMFSKQLEHVIEKRQPTINVRTTHAVKTELDADVGLFGFAPDFCAARRGDRFGFHFVIRSTGYEFKLEFES